MFCIYLRTNSELCHLQHKLIGFYNRDEKCLQRGTDWVFESEGYIFVLTGVKYVLDLRFYVVIKLPEYGTLVPENVGFGP